MFLIFNDKNLYEAIINTTAKKQISMIPIFNDENLAN